MVSHSDARQRAADALERSAALLAEPVDPELRRRASEWLEQYEARQAEERAAEAARAAREAETPASHKAAPAPAQRPAEGMLSRKSFRRYTDGLEEALGRMFGHETHKKDWRFAEAERRIAEVEARLAKLEGRSDG